MTLDDLNALDHEAFVRALGGVFEHSPWVADAASRGRPFASVASLHAAMLAALAAAGPERQLAFVRLHPELAGKAMLRRELTVDSSTEQSSAGLDQCSAAELDRLHALNAAYVARFGFPFILAVKGLDRTQIIERFAQRLSQAPEEEFAEALTQIARITRFRLDALLTGRPP